MEFKDYYAELGLTSAATQDEIKRSYRKLARKYHPDLSKEPNAEARFKDVAEAHEALIDPERRAAYDEIVRRRASGERYDPSGGDGGFEFSGRGGDGMSGGGADFSDFFESLFGSRAGRGAGGQRHAGAARSMQGSDHHARLSISLQDAYRGAQRTMSLRMPVIDEQGRSVMVERQLDVSIPAGVRAGQHLRLQGQGAAGEGGGPAGDLYLEIDVATHPVFRLDGRDVYFHLPVAPWEAALGASVQAPTPGGPVQLSVPPGSTQGRKLRLKGKGLPGAQPGDLYAVLAIAVPASPTETEKQAWNALAAAYPLYNPRAALEA